VRAHEEIPCLSEECPQLVWQIFHPCWVWFPLALGRLLAFDFAVVWQDVYNSLKGSGQCFIRLWLPSLVIYRRMNCWGHFFLARYFNVRIAIVFRFAFSAGEGWVLCAGLCNVVFLIRLERIVRGRLFGGPINVALPVRVCVVAGGEIVLHDGDASVVSSHPNPLQVYWTWDGLCKATASGQNVRQPGFVWALVIETLHLLAKLPQA